MVVFVGRMVGNIFVIALQLVMMGMSALKMLMNARSCHALTMECVLTTLVAMTVIVA